MIEVAERMMTRGVVVAVEVVEVVAVVAVLAQAAGLERGRYRIRHLDIH